MRRRAFLGLLALVAAPAPAHAHHRTGHGKGGASLDVYTDRY